MRRAALALAAVSALLAGCGDGSDATTVTTPSRTTTVPSPVTAQIAALKECLGGEEVTRVDVFEPTYQYVQRNGGGGFAMMVGKQQVQLLVAPNEDVAQITFRDAQDQLIALQQSDPERYATLASAAMQVLAGRVVEIVPSGAPPPRQAGRITACAQEAVQAGA